MSTPSLVIVDSDLSTPAMVQAACDLEHVTVHEVRDVESARELIESEDPDVVMLAGDLDDAAELLVELLGQTIIWLGSEGDPGAEMATEVLAKPIDIVSMQMALETHLQLSPPEVLSAPELGDEGPDTTRIAVVEAERDALLAEVEVLRHETGLVKREAQAANGAVKRSVDEQLEQYKTKLADAMAALDTQRRTAEALQSAYGEVEQSHGKLLQRYEALEAERDALAERSRDVSSLREQLELAQRDNAILKARLAETAVQADNAKRALGLRASTQHEAEEAMSEVGWWQDALKEAVEDGPQGPSSEP